MEFGEFLGILVFGVVILIGLLMIGSFLALVYFTIKALIKYIKSSEVRKEKTIIRKSLGEVLKSHREKNTYDSRVCS